MTKLVEAVTVCHFPSWQKYPDTQDRDYSAIMSQRKDRMYCVNGEDVIVRSRPYPAFHAYAVTGRDPPIPWNPKSGRPYPSWYTDNTVLPDPEVLDAMVHDFVNLAEECRICYWESAVQCFLPVVAHLKELFAHSILIFGDDCTACNKVKTGPIAGAFDTVFNRNVICTEDGERSRNMYRRLGVKSTYFVSISTRAGFVEGLEDRGWMSSGVFDLDRRIQQLHEHKFAYDMVFAGNCAGKRRIVFNESVQLMRDAGLRVRLHGARMADGILHPYYPEAYHPRGPSWPVAELFLNSLSAVNVPFSALLGWKMFDAWASGTLVLAHDSVGELEEVGIKPDVHYASYDGTIPDLIAKVKHYRDHIDEVEPIIRAGYAFGQHFPKEHSIEKAWECVLAENGHKWSW